MPTFAQAADGWRALADQAGALREEMTEVRADGPAGENSLLPASADEYAEVAATTPEDVETLAPVVPEQVRRTVEEADPTLDDDVALYPAARDHPVARLAARNFLGQPTVVLAYPPRTDGWQLVLTPARRRLPSAGPGAIAQSYGWVRADAVPRQTEAAYRVEISVPRGRLTISGPDGTQAFPADVGGPQTPTPTGVVGYLQARYLDPAQGQSAYRIQLTSLHATAADEPYGGDDGGLIGLHLGSGSSHGCVRLGAAAIAAVDALPLGTPVRIVGAGDGA